MMSQITRRTVCGLLAGTFLVLGDRVLAEDTARSSSMAIEEIIVTSRKRDERSQDVPEQLTVFSARTIETAKIENLRSFVDLTPNLIVRETFRSNETFLSMRGLSSAQGALPPVAFVVDGVQLGSNDFINQDLMDIERIEVLRGPQGTLYGQGAIAGAIVITTEQPTNEFEGMLKGTYGNDNSFRVASAISGPIIENKLLFRVSGYYKESDGLIKNAAGVHITPYDQYNVRGLLNYQSENLRIAVRGSHTDGNGFCCYLDKVPLSDPNDPNSMVGIDDVTNPGIASNILGIDETSFFDTSMKIDYDIGYATLTSITSYAEVRQFAFGDADYTAAPAVFQDLNFDQDVFNQELRVGSNDDNPLQWMFGSFYQDKQDRQRIVVAAEATPMGPFVLNQFNITNSEAWAVFGQLSYDVTDKFKVLLAGRYDHDKQDNLDRLNPVGFREATFKQFQPKAQLSYRWTDDFLVYATYSTGFRTGGYTQNIQFDNEVSTNYEIGFKGTFLDRLLIINGSAFHIDYDNQIFTFVLLTPGGAQRGGVNIPATDIDGFELEIAAQPMEGLDVSVGIGVADTTITAITALDPALGDVTDAVGNRSPLVAPLTFNLGVTYTRPIANGLDLVMRGDYRHQGGLYFDIRNLFQTKAADYIDGRIALEGENWSFGVWAKNLINTRRATRVSETGNQLRTPNFPRSYGIEASLRF